MTELPLTTQTDWVRLDSMEDKDIDFSEIPEIAPEQFAKAVVRRGLEPRTKSQLTLRIDSDVIEWFKEQGQGWQTQINALLRACVDEHQAQARLTRNNN